MIDVLNFIFDGPVHFVGTLILIAVTGFSFPAVVSVRHDHEAGE